MDDVNHFWDNEGIWAVWDADGTRYASRRYLFVSSGQESVASAFRYARAFPTICVLTTPPEDFNVSSASSEVIHALLLDLAEHAAHILVGAFDEMGYVIWSRSQP